MKKNGSVRTLSILSVFFMFLTLSKSLRPHHFTYHGKGAYKSHSSHIHPQEGGSKEVVKEELGMELYPTGSRLPDCSHACGPCYPCKRVMVSFKCSVAESCPIVYRCTCKGRYYHVPSN
ncbi:hypothetical protein M9H77_31872 [Catharanthus roseus]|uniref:Uncharacterized protein n=1 Tax=Catharanthus roseus TaxID=4058 RepID=A0ACC0A196_CATRO|nr:hypothetical protein M9H77_31872 [Catharanthus roseus]